MEVLLKQAMREYGLPFKQALNEALRTGLARRNGTVDPFCQRTFALGRPRVELTKALALAAKLDDKRTIAIHRQ